MKKITTGLGLVGLACCAAAFGAGFAIYLRPVEASRNGSGTMSAYSPGNPVVTGTSISSSWANNTIADFVTEITDSLSRSGKGGMLAALRGIDGTVSAPAFSWTSETGSGLFRNTTNDVRMSINSATVEKWLTTGVTITGTAAVSSTLTSDNITASHTSGTAFVAINAATASNQAYLGFQDQGTNKYQLYKSTTNTLVLTDNANGRNILTYSPGAATPVVLDVAQIGASGTAITASNAGTVSWNPGSIAAQTCASNTITVTGGAQGAPCAYGVPGFPTQLSVSCGMSSSGTCSINVCNPTTGAISGSNGTYSCRAFNP